MVYQYDLDGNYITSYISCSEAERQTGASGISNIAREDRPSYKKSCGGFL